MYLDWFQLRERPFSISPDPRYLFLSERHREALAHLLYGVGEGGGVIQLTGEVGMGKTTLTRTLLEQLPERVDVALVYNPRATLTEFLESICDELDVAVPPDAHTAKRLTDALDRHLLAAHERGRRTVLIIDEAQNLSADVLEQVRLLTNLETSRDKLLQVLLVGQPELRTTLARDDLRQLAQRITARYHLEPLDPVATAAYVRHRCEVAGARTPLFTRAALRAVHRIAGGIPRAINILCDRALLGAFADQRHAADATLVRRAAREIRGELAPARPRWSVIAATVAVVATGGSAVAWHLAPPLPVPADDGPRLVRVPPPAPPSLPTLASLLPPTDDLAASARELLARWQVPVAAALPAGLCTQAAEAGLACVRGRGTWNNLRVLDRPALLELRSDGHTRTVLLVGLDGDTATLHAGGAPLRVPLLALDAAWLGDYLLLWRPPIAGVLQRGDRGDGVRWLRDALDAPGDPVYDAALERRVRGFQARYGLQVDGVAGEQTLMHLDGLRGHGGARLDVPDP